MGFVPPRQGRSIRAHGGNEFSDERDFEEELMAWIAALGRRTRRLVHVGIFCCRRGSRLNTKTFEYRAEDIRYLCVTILAF